MALGPGTVTAVGLLVGAALNTVIAVIAIRFLRVRLATRWAPVIYALFLLPLVFVPTTIGIAGVVGASGVTVEAGTLVGVLFVVPIGLGFALDFFWLPPPEAVEVPAETEG